MNRHPSSPVVDSHCHLVFKESRGGRLEAEEDSFRTYLSRADRAGIEKTILFPALHRDYRAANAAVARITGRWPERFIGFAFVHPDRDKGGIYPMAARAVWEYGFCGMKAHRRDARITREVCATADRLSVPLIYDIMGETDIVPLLASEYPNVTFIIPHLGSFADDARAQHALIRHLAAYPNIFTDTAGVRHFDLLASAVTQAGATKILYGSDGPWLHPGLELAKITALHLAADEEALILGGNAQRLIAGLRERYATRQRTSAVGRLRAAAAAHGRSHRASVRPAGGCPFPHRQQG